MTPEIRAAIATRFAAPEWALFFEVPSGTGANAHRRADAVAMNLYPSRGLEIHGFEVKIARSDWLRELKDPDKSASVQMRCDRWWICTDDDKIVKDGELPPTWGLMVLRSGKLVVKMQAPALATPPIDRAFVASLLRAATGSMVHRSEVERLAQKLARDNARVDNGAEIDRLENIERSHNHLLEIVRKFEAASGLNVYSGYDGPKLGEAVRAIMHHDTNAMRRFELQERELVGVLEATRKAIAAMKVGA